MKDLLDTLAIIGEGKDDNYSKICNQLSGVLDQVGKGSFGTVFALSEERVLKVYKKYDIAYMAFLKVIQNSGSAHFPKIYNQGHYKKFHTVILERVEPYSPLWGCAEAHVRSLREGFIGRTKGAVAASESLSETVCQALDSIAPLGQFFGLDIWQRNLGIRNRQLIFLDPITNGRTSQEDFEERFYIPKAA